MSIDPLGGIPAILFLGCYVYASIILLISHFLILHWVALGNLDLHVIGRNDVL